MAFRVRKLFGTFEKRVPGLSHSRPQRPHSFWPAPRIATTGTFGKVQHQKSAIHGLPVTLRMLTVMVEIFDHDISEDEFRLFYDANTSKHPPFPYLFIYLLLLFLFYWNGNNIQRYTKQKREREKKRKLTLLTMIELQ